MLRAIALLCLATLVLWLSAATHLSADAGDAREAKGKQIAERARKFEYPAAATIRNFIHWAGFESVVSTPDSLDTVDAWYRKKLAIQPGDGTGVSSRTTLVQEGPKERGYEVPWTLYINNEKLKDGDPKEREPQPATVRSYVVKEEKYTLVVVATRSKDDKATQISVTYIPESSE